MALYLPRALEPAWEPVLRALAPRTVDTAALGVIVARLARRYQGDAVALAERDELLARIRFWFPRDVPKLGLPLAELALAGALPARPLRVLDLGAGLGASTVGVLRTLADAALPIASRTPSHLVAVDRQRAALALYERVVRSAASAGLVAEVARIETHESAIDAFRGTEPFDLVVCVNALVEDTRALGDEATRGAALADRIASLVAHAPLADDGAFVVIEPATRDETRALHHARANLLARGLHVFAPCTHEAPCPMLPRPRDWCHEDLAVDLPPWVEPIARAAGLRWQGLTFSYLVVRTRDDRSVRTLVAPDATHVAARLVSSPIVSKGKTEAFASGEFPHDTFARLLQLDRTVRRGDRRALRTHARGDVVSIARDALDAARDEAVVRVTPEQLGDVEDSRR